MNKIIFTYLRDLYRPFSQAFLAILALMVVQQLTTITTPYLYGKIIDGIIQGKPLQYIIIVAIVSLGLLLFNILVTYIREKKEIEAIDFDISRHIAKTTLLRMFKFSLGQFANENSGLKQSVVNQGSGALRQSATLILYNFLPIIIQVVITIAALLYVDLFLGAIVFFGSVVYIGSNIYYNIYFYPNVKEQQDLMRNQQKRHSEILRYMALVKVHAQEENTIEEYHQKNTEIGNFGKKIWTRFMKVFFIRESFAEIVQFMVLATSIYLVYRGVHTPGTIVVFLAWSNNVFARLGSLGSVQRNLVENIGYVDKYINMLSIPIAVTEQKDPIKPTRFNGEIEFRNVSFSYPVIKNDSDMEQTEEISSSDALRNVSFTIKAGETCAFVGQSGAGKTTLVNLLLRAYDPNGGKILVDGNDLRTLDLTFYRRAIGLVEQQVELFDETLRYNILFGVNNERHLISDEDLEVIAKKACIDKFYHRLGGKKFETLIGERGIRLSGGERQRVGIARALAKDPHILIFDEATSNLDTENEALIHQAMREALRGRTGIIIAHRLSTIKDVDKIVVFDHGQVVGIGTHNELVEMCEPYRRLIEKQVVSF